MIPQFPEFKKVELSDQVQIDAFLVSFQPYSDYNFTSLWSWDSGGQRQVSFHRGNLVVRFSDYTTQEPFLSFLGVNEPDATAHDLIDFAKLRGISPVLQLVPEVSVNGIRDSGLTAEEDRDNFDYIMSVSELAMLEGEFYKTKRKLMDRFVKQYPDALFETEEIMSAHTPAHVSAMLRKWEGVKKIKNKDYSIANEEDAINRTLAMTGSRRLWVSSLFVRSEIVGFSVDEILPTMYGISHFFKADSNYVGAYDLLNLKVSQHLRSMHVAFWNWEQDLGLIGLRKSKCGYAPIGFLKKYRVSLV